MQDCEVFLSPVKPPKKGGEGAEGEEGVETEEDTTVYTYVPPESKEWVSQGSEKEILEESVVQMRRRVCIQSYNFYFSFLVKGNNFYFF